MRGNGVSPVWVVSRTIAMALCAFACGEQSDDVGSASNAPDDAVGDASAQNTAAPSGEVNETGEVEGTDDTTPAATMDSLTEEADDTVVSMPVASEPGNIDAGVSPNGSLPERDEPTPTDSDVSGVNDAGATSPVASSPDEPMPTDAVDASVPTLPSDEDAGLGIPNVPTEFELLPVECTDIPAAVEEGRCITQRTCDTLREYNAACDGTMDELYCNCISGGYPQRLVFSAGTVEQACEASLQWCDPARGPSLGTRVCEPATNYVNDNYCWFETDCGYEWEFEGAVATTQQKRTEGATCSFDADTQKWVCNCTLEGVTWVKYSFGADASLESVCADAYDLCAEFGSMVPEIGAECIAGDNAFTEHTCRSDFECQFPANVGGRNMSVTSLIVVECEREDVDLVCFLGAQRDGTKVASLSPNTNEACIAFSADEIVGLASLPKP